MSAKIFTDQTANGSSLPFIISGEGENNSRGQTPRLDIYGVFDGAALQLEFLKDGGDAEDDADYYPATGVLPITAPDSVFFESINANQPYRLTLSGADSSTEISAIVYNAKLA